MYSALRFTLIEAGLSAIFSVALGALLAHIWMRIEFRGKSLAEGLILLPFFLPPLFVVLAIVRVFGQNGLGFSIYGLNGIVLAHMLLNIPLGFYLVLEEWRRVPRESVMIAEALGNLSGLIEKQVLKNAVPQALALVFLYSALSFTILLTLGGGPSASTIELSIYQAIRFDFDLPKAMSLSLIQASFGLLLILFIKGRAEADIPNAHVLRKVDRNYGRGLYTLLYTLAIGVLLFLFAPPVLLFIDGMQKMPELMEALSAGAFLRAFLTSFILAVLVALMVASFAIFVVAFNLGWIAWLIAAISPLTISTGFILLARLFVNPFDYGLAIVLVIQALTLSPVFIRIWQNVMRAIPAEEYALLATLTDSAFVKLRIFFWPRLWAPLASIILLVWALAFGDLALYPLLAPPGFSNLPMKIWQLLASYQTDAAVALGVLMVGITAMVLMIGRGLIHRGQT